MKKLEKIASLNFDLDSFTNTEWYYIVSNLLCLGGLGSGLIEREKLFVSFDSSSLGDVKEIKFFFISTLPVISEEMISPETSLVLGRVAEGFDDVEYRYIRLISSDIDSDLDSFDAQQISKALTQATIPKMRPLTLVKGLANILNHTSFEPRETNSLFLLNNDSPLESGIRHHFDFGTHQNVDYSGDYYLIVRPSTDSDENATPCNEVLDFVITDNEDENYYPYYIQHKVETKVTKVTDELVELFETPLNTSILE